MLSFLLKKKPTQNQKTKKTRKALKFWTCRLLSLVLITILPLWDTDTLSMLSASRWCDVDLLHVLPLLEQRMLCYRPWKRPSSHLCEQDLRYCSWTRLQGFLGEQDLGIPLQCCFLGFARARLWASTSGAGKQALQSRTTNRTTSGVKPLTVKGLYPRMQTLQIFWKAEKNATNAIIIKERKNLGRNTLRLLGKKK